MNFVLKQLYYLYVVKINAIQSAKTTNDALQAVSKHTAVKVDDEEVEQEAEQGAQRGQEREPTAEHILRAECKRQGQEEYDEMNGQRHYQNIQRYHYELTLGLSKDQIITILNGVLAAKTTQLLHGEDAKRDLDHDWHQVAHDEHAHGDRLAQVGLEKGELLAVRVRIGRDVEEVGVALWLCDEVRGRVDQSTRDEHTEAEQLRRLGAEAAKPCDKKREALEGDHHVEHVLEEVESGDGAQDHAAVVSCGQTECEREVARREAHEGEEDDQQAEHAVERVNAQVLVEGLMVVVCGRCAAYGGESGKTQHVENDAHGAERREQEHIE